MADVRVRIADLAMELFPYHQDTTQALRSLISLATEIIENIEDLERMVSLPVGTVSEDPCYHYETESTPDWELDDENPW